MTLPMGGSEEDEDRIKIKARCGQVRAKMRIKVRAKCG